MQHSFIWKLVLAAIILLYSAFYHMLHVYPVGVGALWIFYWGLLHVQVLKLKLECNFVNKIYSISCHVQRLYWGHMVICYINLYGPVFTFIYFSTDNTYGADAMYDVFRAL